MTSVRSHLFLISLGLALLGLVMVYSATYRDHGGHYLLIRAMHIGLGIGAFLVARRIRYTEWRKYAPWIYFGVLVSLVLVLIPGIGTEIGGSRRWFDLGIISLQPSEFAKLAGIIVISCALAGLKPKSGIPVRPILAVGLLFGMILIQPDFGTSVVLMVGVAGALWASEVRTRDLLLCAGAGFAGLVLVMLLEPYRRDRFMTFLDPWSVADGSGYQVVQSVIAIKSGDFFGAGAGGGGQSAIIPEIQTDMIFALIGEELGLLGMVAVIVAFGAFAVMGFRIALHAPTLLARCMAAGITTMISVQAVFNMGAVMIVLPLAGITLPFISYGGSSLIVCFAAVGILHRISEDSERVREVRPRRKKRKEPVEPVGNEGDDRRGRYGRARDPRAVRG